MKVTGEAAETLKVRVAAPLRVTGRIGNRSVSLVLGDETRTFRVTGRPSGAPLVEPIPPASLYSPPARPTWKEAVTISLTLARVRQYAGYLANPDPLGAYRDALRLPDDAPHREPPPHPSAPQDEGLAAWAIALIAAAAVAAAASLAVVWANS